MFKRFLKWQLENQADYERVRMFQFQAVSALGTVFLGLAALTIAGMQYCAEAARYEAEQREKRKAEQEAEIATSAQIMKSIEYPQQR